MINCVVTVLLAVTKCNYNVTVQSLCSYCAWLVTNGIEVFLCTTACSHTPRIRLAWFYLHRLCQFNLWWTGLLAIPNRFVSLQFSHSILKRTYPKQVHFRLLDKVVRKIKKRIAPSKNTCSWRLWCANVFCCFIYGGKFTHYKRYTSKYNITLNVFVKNIYNAIKGELNSSIFTKIVTVLSVNILEKHLNHGQVTKQEIRPVSQPGAFCVGDLPHQESQNEDIMRKTWGKITIQWLKFKGKWRKWNTCPPMTVRLATSLH